MNKKKAVIVDCFGHLTRIKNVLILLEKEDYEVNILVSDYDHINKKKIVKKDPICEYITVKEYKKNLSLSRIISHNQFANKVKKRLQEIKPDLIYVVFPTNKAGFYCMKYKKKNINTRLVAEIFDMWPESLPVEKVKNTFICKIWRKYRDDCISNADYVFTECQLYKDELKDVIDSESSDVLYLFKNRSEELNEYIKEIRYKNTENVTGYTDTKRVINLCYLGSINYLIDIDSIVNICNILKERFDVVVHIIGEGETRKKFVDSLQNIGCECIYYGKVYDEKRKAEIICKCDLAFNMMKNNVKVGLTIKSVDYFMFGIGIINNIKGDTWDFVENNNIGVNYKKNDIHFVEKIEKYLSSKENDVEKVYNNYFTQKIFMEQLKKGLFVK